MAITRADKYTQTQKKQEYFSDFLNNFDQHPITHSLARVTNEQSVSQSLKNLIYTNYGDRVFEPNVGSNIRAALFEPNDVITVEKLNSSIRNTIRDKEPRVSLVNIVIIPNDENQALDVSILYYILNNPNNIQQLDLILKRVR